MRIIKWIKTLFRKLFYRPFPDKAFDSVNGQFLALNLDSIKNKLKLEECAEKDGGNNIPAPDTRIKDAAATKIDDELVGIVRQAKDDFQDYLDTLSAFDAGLSPLDTFDTKIKNKKFEALDMLYSSCKNGQNTLYSKKRDVADGELAFERFRKENDLDRPADNPDNVDQWLWISILAIAEIILNAWALQEAHPGGFIGAIPEIAGIMIINVFLGGFLLSSSWRKTNHIHKLTVAMGYMICAVVVSFIVLFNYLVGHYRDSLISLKDKAGAFMRGGAAEMYEMYGNLFRTTFERAFSWETSIPGSFMSVIMIFIGIAFFSYATRKFYFMDDPYPGYRRQYRNQNKRNEAYNELSFSLCQELEEIGRHITEGIVSIFEEGRNSYDIIKDHEKERDRLVSKYRSWLSGVNVTGASLYATYRQINGQYRTEATPPAFEIGFSIPDDFMRSVERDKEAAERDGQRNLKHLHKQKNASLSIVNTGIDKYLRVYKGINELAPKDAKSERASAYSIEVEKINRELRNEAAKAGE